MTAWEANKVLNLFIVGIEPNNKNIADALEVGGQKRKCPFVKNPRDIMDVLGEDFFRLRGLDYLCERTPYFGCDVTMVSDHNAVGLF
jgi:hypothetical protein